MCALPLVPHQSQCRRIGGHDDSIGGQGQQRIGHVVQKAGVERFQTLQAAALLRAPQDGHEQYPEQNGHGQNISGLQDGCMPVFLETFQVPGHVHTHE